MGDRWVKQPTLIFRHLNPYEICTIAVDVILTRSADSSSLNNP
jgi:hypothetical protein